MLEHATIPGLTAAHIMIHNALQARDVRGFPENAE